MRIFCFGSDYPPTGGGISTHTREWLSALAKEGDTKVRATIFGNKEPRQEKVGGIIEITTRRSANFFYIGYRIFLDMFRYRHYEIFHAFNLFPVGFWTVFWSRVFNKKSVLTFYGADACDVRTSTKVLWLQRWAITSATWAITISEFTKRQVMKRYAISDKNIRVIHPILPFFHNGDEVDVRKELGIQEDDFIVLSVSRLVKRKGIEYLIEAISKIPDTSVKLIIVGGGPERENLEDISRNLHLSDRVFFTGKVPTLPRYYKAADVTALVSYIIEEEGDFEGLGLVLLEAQSYGVPVIGTQSGGIPEAFDNGKTGLLVPERNADVIAEAVLKLKNDPNLYGSMRNETATFLEREFGWESTVGRYLNMLK